MFDEKTILARLQAGEDAQTIADEMAKMINSANKIYIDQKAAEEAKRQEVESQKKEELQDILDAFADWFNIYYGVSKETLSEINAETMLELIDSLQEYVEALKSLEALIGKKSAVKAPIGTKVIKSNTKPKNADETINDFLTKMGW